jgi:hypothetical protein
MTTESEVKLARYSQVEKEADDFARVIGVRRLKPSEEAKLIGMTPDLTGHEETLNEKGETVQVSHRLVLMVVASVCMIDDARIPFPRNRGELDAMYDRLDREGLAAAGRAMARLNPPEEIKDPQAEAKN